MGNKAYKLDTLSSFYLLDFRDALRYTCCITQCVIFPSVLLQDEAREKYKQFRPLAKKEQYNDSED